MWLLASCTVKPSLKEAEIMTVRGGLAADKLGTSLIHEHILVDFRGAKLYDPSRWRHDEVIKKVLPYLVEVKAAGCQSFFDCTPNFLGRDVLLLKKLSERSGLNIITNTGIYGGSNEKFLPDYAFEETAAQLAERWIVEANEGIDQTGIRPGFIKISVNDTALTEISKKLISAAALTHLQTGLTIASHTGKYQAAREQLEILNGLGVDGDAFIWVHAQAESNFENYVEAIQKKCWVSLDNVSDGTVDDYLTRLEFLKDRKLLSNVLISHDAGWYDPDKPDGEFRHYNTIFSTLIDRLKGIGFSSGDIETLLRKNPAKAFNPIVKRVKTSQK